MNNQSIAQISRIEDYITVACHASFDTGDFLRERACYQALLIIRMVSGDSRYTLASIMEVE